MTAPDRRDRYPAPVRPSPTPAGALNSATAAGALFPAAAARALIPAAAVGSRVRDALGSPAFRLALVYLLVLWVLAVLLPSLAAAGW